MRLEQYKTDGPSKVIGRTNTGLFVTVEAEPEDRDAAEYWHNETDCFSTLEAAQDFARESSNPFWWCTVKVTAIDPTTLKEASEYLGACNYKDGRDFINNSGYFNDMLQAASKALAN